MVSKKFMREASKKYYEANSFSTNKNRILKKIQKENYIPKLSTLIKYNITVKPKLTPLEQSIAELEKKAIKRLGMRTVEQLKEDEKNESQKKAVQALSRLTKE